MHGKEFLIGWMRDFFVVVTLINVAMYIMGIWLAPDVVFGYEVFAAPLIYGVAGTLPNLVMYSTKELSVRALVIRKVIQFVLIEVLVLFAAFGGAEEYWHKTDVIISVAISIFVIYVIASMIDWVQNYVEAKRMTDELMKFQERIKG